LVVVCVQPHVYGRNAARERVAGGTHLIAIHVHENVLAIRWGTDRQGCDDTQ